MRSFRKLLWAAPLLLSACAGVDVHTDYDNSVDFSQYTTYFWKMLPDSANSLMNGRIVSAVDGQLYARGWRKVAENEAQTALAAVVTVRDGQRVDTVHNNLGPTWNGWGSAGMSGMTSSRVVNYRVGTLVIDLYDTKGKNAIWRGSASDILSSGAAAMQRSLNEGVQKMFANFPPGAQSNPRPN
ncbi:MAG: DUF4136 domain-containing protein [Candidatus Methylumidiphilus sp.]